MRSAGRVSGDCRPTDDLTYLREFEHITLARALLARTRPSATSPLSTRQPSCWNVSSQAAEEGDRTGSVIEILVLQALALRCAGTSRAALPPLERALALAEPEGYVRMFVDEGPAMASLLEAAATPRDRPRLCAHGSRAH